MAGERNEVPRRIRIDLFSEAEKAIYDATWVVERAGAHPHLTDAVVLLQKAREAVADFVDGVPHTQAITNKRLGIIPTTEARPDGE